MPTTWQRKILSCWVCQSTDPQICDVIGKEDKQVRDTIVAGSNGIPASRLISAFVAVEKRSDFGQDSVDANDMAEEDLIGKEDKQVRDTIVAGSNGIWLTMFG
jgi:hypothetical protein